MALAYGLLGFIGWLVALADESGGSRAVLWGAPLLAAAAGYASGIVYCTLYNVAARWTGGVELQVEDPEQ